MLLLCIPESYRLQITANILRNDDTHEGIMPYNGSFVIFDRESEGIIGGWSMEMSLTDVAITNLNEAIEKSDKEKQKEIFSSFNSYSMTVDGVLLAPGFSKIIVSESGNTIIINYNHIKEEIWENLAGLLG